jgi:hypothetical protein
MQKMFVRVVAWRPRSVKVEFELEGTTASEWVAMEGVTPVALLCLGIQGIFAVVELLSHF